MEVLDVHVGLQGHSKIDFDKRLVNRELLVQGRRVQRTARRLVARKAVSEAGQFPGKQTGALQKAIDLVKPRSKLGFWIKVEPTTAKIKRTGKIYYPAILFHGSKKRNIEPRENYMVASLEMNRETARAGLRAALAAALIPR